MKYRIAVKRNGKLFCVREGDHNPNMMKHATMCEIIRASTEADLWSIEATGFDEPREAVIDDIYPHDWRRTTWSPPPGSRGA